jgi:protocatechuate 3,4-dioxygenase beta subunit
MEVTEGETSELIVGLVPFPHVRGLVLDPGGEPVSGATVRIGTHGPPAQTDAAGRFEVEPADIDCSEDYVFTLWALHEGRDLAIAQGLADGPQTVQVTLQPCRTIIGRVVDPEGRPIPGAQVKAAVNGPRGYSPYGEPVMTNAEGQYQLRHLPLLPLGDSFQLEAAADGHGRQSTEVFPERSQDERLAAPDLVLKRADLSVSGVVVDAEGHAVSGATVGTYGEGQRNWTVRTDDEGRFRIDNLCPGKVTLYMADGPTSVHAEVDAGATGIKLVRARVPDPSVPLANPDRLP